MENQIERYARLFRGLNRAYGALDLTTTDARGKQKGVYKFVHEPRTKATFAAHLRGETSIGVVPINEENNCLWGAIDVDQYPLDHSEILEKLKRLEIPLVVCRSKSGGAHLYLFLRNLSKPKRLSPSSRKLPPKLATADRRFFRNRSSLCLSAATTGTF